MKPILLDLFCGAGGAAKGYQQAGFYVVGIDIVLQPRYCGDEFLLGDALEFPLTEIAVAAIHASPPCQGYSRLRHLPWLRHRVYPRLVDAVRERLQQTGRPWIIENVQDAPMPYSIVLCGTQFGLPVYRHRRFGASFLLWDLPHEKHQGTIAAGRASLATRYRASGGVTGIKEISRASLVGYARGALAAGRAMGIDWMRREELTQAIPPAYTRYVGEQLLRVCAA